eukprot:2866873-Prymnesium_polylepis.2
MQVLVYASSHNVVQHYGKRAITRHLLTVYTMFLLGTIATLPPPYEAYPALERGWTILWLAASMPLLVSLVSFVWDVLPMALTPSIGADADADDKACGWAASRTLRAIRASIVGSWLLFPLAWLGAATGVLSAEVESLVYAYSDGIAKALTSLVLYNGSAAIQDWEAQMAAQRSLASKEVMIGALKEFTQSIGHDLRTPLQALVFCNLRAQDAIDSALTACAPPA